MKSRLLGAILSVLLWAVAGRADVTDPTPYDYDHPPKAGREGGTYAFSATGSAGPDCVIALIGALKLLPNGAGTGGNICVKANVELRGTGAACALAPIVEPVLGTVKGAYRVNGDGTLCEQGRIVGGPLDGMVVTNHVYVDPKGTVILFSAQDIAYACPGEPANGEAIFSGTGIKVSKHGDDPPGSGTLTCTNP